MKYLFGLTLLAVLGVVLFVRLAPSDLSRWHVDISATQDSDTAGSALRVLRADANAFESADKHMRALPRTKVVAGSVEDRHITYITRSRVFGFPDYTTLQYDQSAGQFKAYARLRFGTSDLGVNRKRLDGLVAVLQGG